MTCCTMAASFNREQFVGVRDLKDEWLYKTKIVEMDGEQQSVREHYVGWNSKYDKVVPLSSCKVGEWQPGGGSSGVMESLAGETLLNVPVMPCGSEESIVRNSVGHASSGYGVRL